MYERYYFQLNFNRPVSLIKLNVKCKMAIWEAKSTAGVRSLTDEGVKLERWEGWFEPALNIHTLLSQFFICPFSAQKPKLLLLGIKIFGELLPPCPPPSSYAYDVMEFWVYCE
jgi:hypothetical protein